MTKDHETEHDDLVERLEDSKGWPNLGKAAAARIRADAEVIKAAEKLADEYASLIANVARLQEFNLDQDFRAFAAFCQAIRARAALEEKNDE